jgi:hypothetical protein
MPDPDLTQAFEDAANSPKSATGDNGSITQQSIPDLIALDRYVRGRAAGLGRGFRISKFRAGGSA